MIIGEVIVVHYVGDVEVDRMTCPLWEGLGIKFPKTWLIRNGDTIVVESMTFKRQT